MSNINSTEVIDKWLNFYSGKRGVDKQKVVSVLIYAFLGILIGIILAQTIYNQVSKVSLPGFLSLIAIILICSHYMIRKNIPAALRTAYLLPVAIYFLFISYSYALFPPCSSYYFSCYTLVIGSFFFLIYSPKIKYLFTYAIIGIATLIAHVILSDYKSELFNSTWTDFGERMNPVLAFIFYSAISIFLYHHYNRIITTKEQKIQRQRRQIDITLRDIKEGVIVLKVERDEQNEVCGLKIDKANKAFQDHFLIVKRRLDGLDAEVILNDIFRDSFDWHNFYLQKRRSSAPIFFSHLDKWFQIHNILTEEDQIVSFFHDLTEHKNDVQNLSESEKRYKALLEAVPDMYFVMDKDGIYVDYVAKDQAALNINPEDIIGNSIFEVGFSHKMTRTIYQSIQNVIKFNTIESIEYAFETPHGTMLFEMRMVKLNDQSVISLSRDITKRKLTEQRMEEAREKAESADKLKSAFLANLSHEVRTPMNAIIGFARMLESSDFSHEERARFVNIIVHNGELLLKMITDMISLSKIEANQIQANKSLFKVNQLLTELLRNYTNIKNQDSNKKTNVKLTLVSENQNPNFAIFSDSSLLREILSHLIDNAIKFTEKGEIKFGYHLADNQQIEFYVQDTGIGIPMDAQEKIFARFHQLDNGISKEYGGTGLGLSIAQHYANQLGSKISFESEIHKGTRFFFAIKTTENNNHLKIV